MADIESLIGEPLPDTARSHRSWWANDPVAVPHSLMWLSAGWKVDDVDFNTNEVAFRNTTAVLMQLFFLDLLHRLKAERPGITAATRASPQNWWSFGAGRSGFSFGWAFPRDPVLRVELYIDTGDKDQNKTAFETLERQKVEIELEIGSPLKWGKLEHRRASRVSLAHPGQITDPPEKLEVMKQWAVDTMLRFVDAFEPRIRELQLG